MAAVAALFQRTFRDPARPAPAALVAALIETYLGHPWHDPDIASRVYVDAAGKVTGFVGVFPGRFTFRGRAVRAAIAGTLMVEDRGGDPLAGAKLLRSVTKGPQDITISETTNLLSRRLWEPLGGRIVPLLSLDWFRVLRPAAAAQAMAVEKRPGLASLAGLASAADLAGRSWTRRALDPGERDSRLTVETAPSSSDLAAAILALTESVELRPAWSRSDIEWLLAQAEQKARYGSFRRGIVLRNGRLAGCYIYHGRAGGIGRVLQVLAGAKDYGDVADCLFRDADSSGIAAVRGRAAPMLTEALLNRRCIFLHRASTVIHTADEELAGAILSGKALISGLAGESWARLVGDDFR